MDNEEILELIGNVSPHARDYVKSSFDNNRVDVIYAVSTEQNKGVFLSVSNKDFYVFYASFINEHNMEQILEIISNKTSEYLKRISAEEICFNVYGRNTKIISLVRELEFKTDMEGYHLEYVGRPPELVNCNLIEKGFESSMINEFIDLFDSAYLKLNRDNGWIINGHALNKEGFHKRLSLLNDLGQVCSFWLNNEIAGAYCFEQNYISDIVVSPRFQGKGYGSYILAHCIRNMKESKSIENIRLRVAKTNTGARRLYERNNFIEIACFAEHTYNQTK